MFKKNNIVMKFHVDRFSEILPFQYQKSAFCLLITDHGNLGVARALYAYHVTLTLGLGGVQNNHSYEIFDP